LSWSVGGAGKARGGGAALALEIKLYSTIMRLEISGSALLLLVADARYCGIQTPDAAAALPCIGEGKGKQ